MKMDVPEVNLDYIGHVQNVLNWTKINQETRFSRQITNWFYLAKLIQNSIQKTPKRHQLSMTFPCVFRILSSET